MAKILIVEDNALNIKLFCDLLAAHGHEPQAVTDSRLALDSARTFAPDLVITDIQLPHVSGLDSSPVARRRASPCRSWLTAYAPPRRGSCGRPQSYGQADFCVNSSQVEALLGREGTGACGPGVAGRQAT